MAIIKSIAVFCGSATGHDPRYVQAGYSLGAMLAQRGISVVYGGSKLGVMGAVADGAIANGGMVSGVIPAFLKTKEIAHEGLSRLVVVESMHERKMKMHALSDGIITLPGGWGTMEEMFEMLTWAQLGMHGKPVGLLNVNGYYNALIALSDNMVQEGFVNDATRSILLADDNMNSLLDRMCNYIPPPVPQWLTKGEET